MDGAKQIPLDQSKLTATSSRFLEAFLAWKPDWIRYCRMDEASYGCDLRIEIPSPSKSPCGSILIWYANDQEDISIEFGGCHFHRKVALEVNEEEFEEWTILEALKLIVKGDIVSFAEAPELGKAIGWVYLKSDFSLANELELASGKIRLISWDGTIDKEISKSS